VECFEVGLVDLSHFVFVHDFDEEIEGLLFGHVKKERGDEEGEALTVADFFVVDGVGFAELVESLLAVFVLEELVTREGAIDVAYDYVLRGGFFG